MRAQWIPSIATFLALATSGCETAPRTSGLSSAIGQYDSGHYEVALSQARTAVSSGGGLDSDKAAVLAGMSAFKLGRLDEAASLAAQGIDSSDPKIAGQARVVVADVELSRGDAERAATFFDLAASDFDRAKDVPNASMARSFASKARAIAAPPAPATTTTTSKTANQVAEVAAAPKPASKPAPEVKKSASAQRSYTIRAGSYTTRDAAEKRVKSIQRDVQIAKLPDLRVDEVTTSKGERLFAVRIGEYPSRKDAESAMAKIPRKDLMVGAID